MANNHSLIDDSCSIKPNYQEFREHRNDQAVWSILRKLYGGIVILDETYPRHLKVRSGQQEFYTKMII